MNILPFNLSKYLLIINSKWVIQNCTNLILILRLYLKNMFLPDLGLMKNEKITLFNNNKVILFL